MALEKIPESCVEGLPNTTEVIAGFETAIHTINGALQEMKMNLDEMKHEGKHPERDLRTPEIRRQRDLDNLASLLALIMKSAGKARERASNQLDKLQPIVATQSPEFIEGRLTPPFRYEEEEA